MLSAFFSISCSYFNSCFLYYNHTSHPPPLQYFILDLNIPIKQNRCLALRYGYKYKKQSHLNKKNQTTMSSTTQQQTLTTSESPITSDQTFPHSVSTSSLACSSSYLKNVLLFVCPCSRRYKSYAALYTHAKTKHPEKFREFMEGASKPGGNRSPKGRPRKYTTNEIDLETKKINVLELGLIELYDMLNKAGYPSITLSGNQKNSQAEILQQYRQIKNKLGSPTSQLPCLSSNSSSYSQDSLTTFYNKFSKHLQNKIAAKLLYTLSDHYQCWWQPNNSRIAEIWYNCPEVEPLIKRIYEQWRDIV